MALLYRPYGAGCFCVLEMSKCVLYTKLLGPFSIDVWQADMLWNWLGAVLSGCSMSYTANVPGRRTLIGVWWDAAGSASCVCLHPLSALCFTVYYRTLAVFPILWALTYRANSDAFKGALYAHTHRRTEEHCRPDSQVETEWAGNNRKLKVPMHSLLVYRCWWCAVVSKIPKGAGKVMSSNIGSGWCACCVMEALRGC